MLQVSRDERGPGEAYATVRAGGHRETCPLKGVRFTRWLTRSFYRQVGKAPSAQALTDARAAIAAMAAFDGPERPVFLRVAGHEGAVYLDLCNERWEVAEVTGSGWRVVTGEAAPVRFVRRENAAALPRPASGSSVEDLKPLLNVGGEEDFRLLVGWLVGALNPEGPYPVLVLQGEQGSAFSSIRARLSFLAGAEPERSSFSNCSRSSSVSLTTYFFFIAVLPTRLKTNPG